MKPWRYNAMMKLNSKFNFGIKHKTSIDLRSNQDYFNSDQK